MNIVVIGGTGRIGARVVALLRKQGHGAVAAAPQTGVDTLTGEGLAEVLVGAETVIDVANSPSFDAEPAMRFFQTAGRNLLAAEQLAGVRHHLALSVVGTDRLQASGYFRAKLMQEELIKTSTIPYTILRSTQFFPFVSGIIESGAVGDEIRLPETWVQPISADDVADALAELAVGPAANTTLEVAGPDLYPLKSLAEVFLSAKGDPRHVVTDPAALYFGAALGDRTLTPGEHPRIGKVSFEDWIRSEIPAD